VKSLNHLGVALTASALLLTACPSKKDQGDAGTTPAPANTAPTLPPPGVPNAEPPKPPEPPPLSAEDAKKVSYVLGTFVATRTPLATAELSEAELEEVMKGIADATQGKELAVKLSDYGPKVDQLLQAKAAARGEKQKELSKKETEKFAKEKGARRTTSGLVYLERSAGKGRTPKPTETVKVHYKGTLLDGKEFDSSYARNQPAEFPLNGVIPCWTEGVGLMKVGGKSRLVCPPDIAYGERGRPGIPPNSVLVFEVELLEIKGS
jgi:FKBP-type peptidyl-prolyl cis-trans isomerase FkpA